MKRKGRKRPPAVPARSRNAGGKAGRTGWAGPAALVVAATPAYVLVCGFTSFASWVVAGLLAGAFVGLGARSSREALGGGAAAGLLGGLISAAAFSAGAVVTALNAMPSYANADVFRTLYTDTVLPLMQGNWVNSSSLGASAPWLLTLLAAGATGAVAWGVAAVKERPAGGIAAGTLLAWAAIAVLVAAFVNTAAVYGSPFRTAISREPADSSYAYDGYIGLRTYYEMGKGVPYYPAVVRAAAGDARLIKEKAVVDGKFRSWAFSPSFIKMPYAYYLWRLVAPVNGGGIFVFSVAVCAVLLAASFWAFEPYLAGRAMLVPVLLFPFLLIGTVWANVLMTEWWAALAGLGGLLLAARGRFAAAAFAGLAAALFREVMAIELVIFLAAGAWSWLRGRSADGRRAAITSAVLLAVFFALYALHYRSGAPYIAAGTTGVTPVTMLQNSAVRPLEAKFLAPSSYLMFAYGYFTVPVWPLLMTGVAGLVWALREDRVAMLGCAGFLAFWSVFTLTVGATSSYWGQFYMPVAIVGTSVLLADLGGFVDRIAGRLEGLAAGA